jgi:DNA (cytosine-5)-methyltransferase 1
VQTGYGERDGQQPRSLDIGAPLGTVVAGRQKHALVAAFLAKHYGGNETPGTSMRAPMDTITTQDHHALVTAHTDGDRREDVRALLMKYYGSDQDPRLDEPLHTITTRDRFGLVTVHGEQYAIADIGMRMLQPRELYRAQGFPESYIIDFEHGGKPLPKAAQVRMCGNSVSPPVAEALVRANFAHEAAWRREEAVA